MFLKAMILIPVLTSYRDLLKSYSLMMNTAVFLKTLYLWGKLTIIACFIEFHSVWVVLSTVDQPISICKLIFGFWKVQRFCAPYILTVLLVESSVICFGCVWNL